jgi:hypothetical protein
MGAVPVPPHIGHLINLGSSLMWAHRSFCSHIAQSRMTIRGRCSSEPGAASPLEVTLSAVIHHEELIRAAKLTRAATADKGFALHRILKPSRASRCALLNGLVPSIDEC